MRVAPVASTTALLVAFASGCSPNGTELGRSRPSKRLGRRAGCQNRNVTSSRTPKITRCCRFAQTANGNVAPSSSIVGSATQLNEPTAVYAGPSGKIYVTSFGNNSIEVFAAGASGNQKPLQNIFGNKTVLSNPVGIALDSKGDIYVANSNTNSIGVFAAGATGNVKPIRTLSGGLTGLLEPSGLALNASDQLAVGNVEANSLTVYAAGAKNNAAPIATIGGPATTLKPAGRRNVRCERKYLRRELRKQQPPRVQIDGQ